MVMYILRVEMRQHIRTIQIFRGFAALGVVAHHTVQSTNAFFGDMPKWVHHTIGQGKFGVDFFFVLSGFIIMFVHQHDRKSFSSVKKYLIQRFIRVYPVYWLVAMVIGIAYFLMPAMSQSGGREINVISSILLIPSEGVPVLSVAWTLIHEVMFYIFFLLFFFSNALFSTFIVLWVVCIAVANFVEVIWVLDDINHYFFSLLNIEFIFGMLAAITLKHVCSIKLGMLLTLCGGLIGVVAIYGVNLGLPDSIRLIFAFGMAQLIIGAAIIERRVNVSFPAVLILLGDASYSIYLIHKPALSITQRIFSKMNFGWEMALFLGVIITTLFGVIFHLIVEKSLIRIIRHKLAPSRVQDVIYNTSATNV